MRWNGFVLSATRPAVAFLCRVLCVRRSRARASAGQEEVRANGPESAICTTIIIYMFATYCTYICIDICSLATVIAVCFTVSMYVVLDSNGVKTIIVIVAVQNDNGNVMTTIKNFII